MNTIFSPSQIRLIHLLLVALIITASILACTVGDLLDPRSEYSPWGRATLTTAAREWYSQQTAIAVEATVVPIP